MKACKGWWHCLIVSCITSTRNRKILDCATCIYWLWQSKELMMSKLVLKCQEKVDRNFRSQNMPFFLFVLLIITQFWVNSKEIQLPLWACSLASLRTFALSLTQHLKEWLVIELGVPILQPPKFSSDLGCLWHHTTLSLASEIMRRLDREVTSGGSVCKW